MARLFSIFLAFFVLFGCHSNNIPNKSDSDDEYIIIDERDKYQKVDSTDLDKLFNSDSIFIHPYLERLKGEKYIILNDSAAIAKYDYKYFIKGENGRFIVVLDTTIDTLSESQQDSLFFPIFSESISGGVFYSATFGISEGLMRWIRQEIVGDSGSSFYGSESRVGENFSFGERFSIELDTVKHVWLLRFSFLEAGRDYYIAIYSNGLPQEVLSKNDFYDKISGKFAFSVRYDGGIVPITENYGVRPDTLVSHSGQFGDKSENSWVLHWSDNGPDSVSSSLEVDSNIGPNEGVITPDSGVASEDLAQ
jgi:hypothetical protein